MTPLQLRLKNNPFAQALAAPVRACATTATRLPTPFLINFELLRHPSTGRPWCLPKGINANPKKKAPEVEAGDESTLSASTPTAGAATGPTVYALSRHALVSTLNRPASRSRMHSPRKAEKTGVQAKDVVWREDMADFTMKLLRERVVHELGYLASRSESNYLLGCKGAMTGETLPYQTGAVLWLGSTVPVKGDGAGINPPAYSTMSNGQPSDIQLAVYNLPRLLGDVQVARLRERLGRDIGHEEMLAIKSKSGCVAAQMWLWKLQGYMQGIQVTDGS
ncbi:MAG: hypothetical protein M1832_002228 [Thelocarpon impressellum]|nr:MAG: hypothetical protein M1832_002228 [Thelocarpon impressellum]